MYYCPKCNYSTEELSNFCPVCGAKTEVRDTAVVPEVTDSAPSYSKAKLILGGIFGIVGFIAALALAVLAAAPVFFKAQVYAPLRFMAYTYCITALELALPLTILGFLFCNGVLKKGARSGLAKAGRLLGLFGIILVCAAIVISVFNIEDISNLFKHFSGADLGPSMYDF